VHTRSVTALIAVVLITVSGCGTPTTTSVYESRTIATSSAPSATSLVSGVRGPSASAIEPSSSTTTSGAPSRHLTRITMIDSSSGWAVGEGDVFYTRNGATRWQDVTPTGVGVQYARPIFLGNSAWLFSGSRCAVYYTNDGGTNWMISSPVIPQSAPSVDLCSGPAQMAFANPTDGYLAFGPESMMNPISALYSTTNGGKTWNHVQGNLPVASIFAVGPQFLLGVSPDPGNTTNPPEGILWQSMNGGASWQVAPVPYPEQVKSSSLGTSPVGMDGSFASASTVIIAMNLGQTLWLEEALPAGHWATIGSVLTLPSTASGVSVSFLSTVDAFVFDSREGALFRTTDKGAVWDSVTANADLIGNYVTFASPNMGWAIDPSTGTLLATSDAGTAWQRIPYATTDRNTSQSGG